MLFRGNFLIFPKRFAPVKYLRQISPSQVIILNGIEIGIRKNEIPLAGKKGREAVLIRITRESQ